MRYTDERRSAVVFNGQTIPRTHRLWVAKGIYEAEAKGYIESWVNPDYVAPEDPNSVKAREEREWRDEKLREADIELNITQDGGGTRTVREIRDWRVELRDYPEHPEFPWGPRPPYPVEEVVSEDI